jgi:hypothetical protein
MNFKPQRDPVSNVSAKVAVLVLATAKLLVKAIKVKMPVVVAVSH